MPRIYLCLTLLLSLQTATAQDSSTAQMEAMEAEARQLAARFVTTLKPQLKQAMTEGGPSHAIGVCATKAPQIADALSAESGWRVKRVSLKARNASRAVPDAWEREVLQAFDTRRAAGAAAAELFHTEIVRGQFRYMQAQVAEGLCLTCHGDNLPEQARSALETYYPDDTATGYVAGDVRGAISLGRPVHTPGK